MAHSPGPWQLVERDGCGGYRLEDADGEIVDYLSNTRWIDEREDPDQEANCRLIAAAPCLLDALTEVITVLRENAVGTPLNNHRFDAVGRQANNALALAKFGRVSA